MRLHQALIVAAVLAAISIAFLVGRASSSDAPSAAPAPAGAGAAAAPAPLTGPARSGHAAAGVDRGALRQVIREELSAALDDRDANAAAANEPEPEAPTEANLAATKRAHAVVASARKAGEWTKADAKALRAEFKQMNDAQREELITTLFPAINRGEIKVRYRGRPF